jgi:16S rRNA (cytidine1402-2'-O)-methyltransferase
VSRPSPHAAPPGRLVLVPNTLDFGTVDGSAEPPDLRGVLPLAVIEQAASLRHWVVENAKTARAFLKRVDRIVALGTPLQQLDIVELPRPPKGRGPAVQPGATIQLLAPALAGHDLGLLSEAGMPAVADPGAELVKLAHDAGVPVVPLVGPSSLLLALACSGMNGQSFAFVGYLPVQDPERGQRIRELEALSRRQSQTQLIIETPYRNEALLQALLAHLQPGTRLAVSCGLTLAEGWTRSLTVERWRQLRADQRPSLPGDRPAVFSLLG